MNGDSKYLKWALVLFFVVAFSYSIYKEVQPAKDTQTRASLIAACERSVAKANIFQNFTNEAASARRISAVTDLQAGRKISSLKELEIANRYENYGKQYVALTPQDCNKAYPAP